MSGAIRGTLTREDGGEEPVCLVTDGTTRTVGPDWLADHLPELEDGEGAALHRPGYVYIRRHGAAPWVAVGGPQTKAAKRTLIDGTGTTGTTRWQQPKFDAVVDFDLDGVEQNGVTMEDPERYDLAALGMWELLAGMRVGDLVDFAPRAGFALRVQLRAITAPLEVWDVQGAPERRTLAERLRAEGTAAVAAERLDFAVKKYERALPFAEEPQLQAALHLNVAAVAIKTKRWHEVVRRCDKVLSGLDRRSARALLRRGKAYMELGQFDLARADLKRIPDDAPEHRDAASALRQLAVREAREADPVRGVYRAMLGQGQSQTVTENTG